jgi:uncharacterized protein YkwD
MLADMRRMLAGVSCALLVWVATGCKKGAGDEHDGDQLPDAGQGGGASRPNGTVSDSSGGKAGRSGGATPVAGTKPRGGGIAALPSSFSGDDASGITRVARCALARDGACLRMIDRDYDRTCDRWLADYPAQSASVFLGAKATCDPGETDPHAIDDALRRLNLYRWLLDLAPVSHDETWAADARACAIIQAYLAPTIAHDPAVTAECYTEQGALASSQSNLAVGDRDPSNAIDGLLFDPGANNAHLLGHRQLLLHPGLSKVGIGYTEVTRQGEVDPRGSTCVQVFTETDRLGTQAAGLDGMVAYPPPGLFPYEPISWAIQGTARGKDGFDRRLQWSLSFADDTDVAGASVRLYRQTAQAFTEVAIDFGALEMASGLWLLPKAEVEPGTYVVIVDGSPLGSFGYRSVIEPCGARLNVTCDIAAQDCGDASAGCYDIDAPYCAVGAGIPLGERCDDRKITECAIACAALCPGQYVLLTREDGTSRPLGACMPGSGGKCNPLAQDCADDHGCYGREAVTCAFAGTLERGQACAGTGIECEPGTDCIGIQGQTPICAPYCDPAPDASGPHACNTLCAWGNWPYNDYALCMPELGED